MPLPKQPLQSLLEQVLAGLAAGREQNRGPEQRVAANVEKRRQAVITTTHLASGLLFSDTSTPGGARKSLAYGNPGCGELACPAIGREQPGRRSVQAGLITSADPRANPRQLRDERLDTVGHKSTHVTETVYRHVIVPAIRGGATVMVTVFGDPDNQEDPGQGAASAWSLDHEIRSPESLTDLEPRYGIEP
jgi:hypothetical protein